MAGMQKKWTQGIRTFLYGYLVKKFGTFETWKSEVHPVNSQKEFYADLPVLAAMISKTMGQQVRWTAVHQQIKFATTSQPTLTTQGSVCNFILNKAAALEAGFLRGKDMPKFLMTTTMKQAMIK